MFAPNAQSVLTQQEQMSPPILSEVLVHFFKYWDQEVYWGMRYGDQLYTYVLSFPLKEESKAYEWASSFSKDGAEVCITYSLTQYSIWINLKSRKNLRTKIRDLQAHPAAEQFDRLG